MICEKCGKEIDYVHMLMFNYDGSDCWRKVNIDESENEDEEGVFLEVNSNWTGYELTEEEQRETIICPHCEKFPFNHNEIQTYEVVRVVCFKGGCGVMARYIDADALRLMVQRRSIPTADEVGMVTSENAERYFIKLIENAPTADVVEVVRCSTCERCKILADEFDNDWYFCMRDYDVEVSANHFCGYGKRKPNLSTIPTGSERSDA